jgi:nucleoside-diphosphate-sugar epimerase
MMSLVFDYLELVADVEPSKPIIAVVTGATGINGNAMVSYLSHFPKQVPTIIAISKSTKNTTDTDWYNAPHVRHLALDLLDTDKVNEQIEYHKHLFAQATHLFHMSYIEKDSDDEMIEVNMKMLRNMIEGLEKVTKLDHVALINGDKYYGSHLGAHKTPYREEDPRPDIKLFYYDQEDYLKARHKSAGWTYSVLRASVILGYSNSSFMNLGATLAAYAVLCKEQGEKFAFPGSEKSWNCLIDFSDVNLIAKMFVWAAVTNSAWNNSFNVVNGDQWRWSELWPKLAEYWGIEWSGPQVTPFKLEEKMKGKNAVWKKIVDKYKLKDLTVEHIATWKFADMIFAREWDSFNDMTKAREFGFAGFASSLVSFKKTFLSYEHRGIIPKIDVLSEHIKEKHDQIAAEKQQDIGVQQEFPSKPVAG